jgi:hypothetical protein
MSRAGAARATLALAVAAAVALSGCGRPAAAAQIANVAKTARRLPGNPLVTVRSSTSLGGNVNCPTVIRVPAWIEHPLGKYYMYFANHMGDSIRLAYADSIDGPWRIHEGGVLHVRETAFWREQPDPPETLADFYTHVASPEIHLDADHRRIVMWVHGWWTNGERWPSDPRAARAWARQNGYGQFTQTAVSADGLQFTVHAPITKTSYLRVFERGGRFYGVSRAGLLSRATDILGAFETGTNLFAGTPYAGRVRHVALLLRGDLLQLYFTAIGDAPERVLTASVALQGYWSAWRAGEASEVLAPQAAYECADLPNAPSGAGDIDVPARQIRDPFIFQDEGRTYLFYATCGEQGIAAAELLPN